MQGILPTFSDMFYTITFSHVTLIRKLQSTSDLDHFHARDLSCSHVKSRDDPISDCRVDSTVPYSFIYTVKQKKRGSLFLSITLANLNQFL